jgi:oligopeptidase A
VSDELANPLLDSTGLPEWSRIQPEHVEPAVQQVLAELNEELDRLEAALADCQKPTWQDVVDPLERLGDRLERPWSAVRHLMGVRNSEPLREAHQAVQGDVVAFGLRVGQSAAIHRALTRLSSGSAWEGLDATQRRIVEALLREAKHAGVGLEGDAKERFNVIQARLAQLGTTFMNHVMDATKAFALTLREPSEVEGLPKSALELAAQAAREAGEEGATAEHGPWRMTLDFPSYGPFMEHARRRDLREQLYRAYVMRAGQGDFDNAPAIEEILALRAEKAALLGYDSYAVLSLSSKMASGVESVQALLDQLRDASYDAALRELQELEAFASTHPDFAQEEPLALWDVAFWAERLREDRYAYSEEELRPWFPLPVVLDGLFDLARRLFEVQVEAADGEAPVWHDDVRFFRVRGAGGDASGELLASFYFDPYSRPGEKNGGAWMDECVSRSALLSTAGEGPRLPVAHVVCNQAPPVDGKSPCMSFREVETLFHEFGHALQHMLTRVDHGLASGIRNVEWDAVELASQFMENWCYQRQTVDRISAHVDTGEPLPDDLFQKLEAARTYRAGSDMLRQLYFAFTDMALHAGFDPAGPETAFDVQQRVAQRTTVMPPLPDDRFLCGFSHIFAGGYAAGYYSYKWAEVLSADAFGAFEEAGLDDTDAVTETGRRYRDTVLALGGSVHPSEVFTRFRGREPRPDALLRHAGLGEVSV